MQTDKRIFMLDIVRATAISLVLICHFSAFWIKDDFATHRAYATARSLFGVFGVEIFFVLSGFLIGGILIKRPPASFSDMKQFWIRRWLRTLPPYYLVMFALALIFGFGWKTICRYGFFVQWIDVPITPPVFFGVSWSLAIEEWAYILLPFVLYKATSENNIIYRVIFYLCILTALRYSIIIFRDYNTLGLNGFEPARILTYIRIDSIIWGVLAVSLKDKFLPKAGYYAAIGLCGFIAILILLVVFPKVIDHQWFLTIGQSLVGALVGMILPYAYVNRMEVFAQNKLGRCISFISAISYPLYLIHFEFVSMLLVKNNGSRLISLLFTVCALYFSIMFSWLMHKHIENPCMAFRDRLFPHIARNVNNGVAIESLTIEKQSPIVYF